MIFNVFDFGNSANVPDKRGISHTAWIKGLLQPLDYLYNLVFNIFKTGSTDAYWAAGTYGAGDRVIFNFGVYESLEDGNTATPTDLTKWRKLQDYFIGADERVLYSCNKLVLEYALNKYFNTTFVQPTGTSDIYITNNSVLLGAFVVGIDEDESSIVYSDVSSEYVINDYAFTGQVNFTIHVPVAVWTALSTVSADRDKIIRSFADVYVCAGLIYDIVTY